MSVYDNDLRPLSLDEVTTYSLASRPSKVALDDFAHPIAETASIQTFLKSLPNILAVQNLRALAGRMRRARELHKPIIWAIGGHVIKSADHIIDLGPEGGSHGGRVVVSGTPEEVARSRRSHTGQVLRPLLNGRLQRNGNGSGEREDKRIA
jgi:hypothetical protein